MNSNYKTKENIKVRIASGGSNTAASGGETSMNSTLCVAPSTSKSSTNSHFGVKTEKNTKTEMASQLGSHGQEERSELSVGNTLSDAPSTSAPYNLRISKQEKDKNKEIDETKGSELESYGQLPLARRPLSYAGIKGRRPIRTATTPRTPKAFRIPRTPKKTPKAISVPKTPNATRSPDAPKTPTAQRIRTVTTTLTASKSPTAPRTPATPRTPKIPRIPKTPETPKISVTAVGSPKVILRDCARKRTLDTVKESTTSKRPCVAVYGLDMNSPFSMLRKRNNIRRFIFDGNESTGEQLETLPHVDVDDGSSGMAPPASDNQNDDPPQCDDSETLEFTAQDDDTVTASVQENTLILRENDIVLESVNSTPFTVLNQSQANATLTLEYSAVENNTNMETNSETIIDGHNTSFTNDIEFQITPPKQKSHCIIA